MKRIRIAAALLCLVTLLSILGLWYQQRTTDRLLHACDDLLNIYESGDTNRCRVAAETFFSDLEKDIRWFPFFLRHERMESVFQHAAALPHLVDEDDQADFFSTVAAIRMQLEILLDNERPLPENIL